MKVQAKFSIHKDSVSFIIDICGSQISKKIPKFLAPWLHTLYNPFPLNVGGTCE